MLKIVSIVGLVVALSFLRLPIARAQDTDGITVHCVGVVVVVVVHTAECSGSNADFNGNIQGAVNHAEPGETVFVGVGVFAEQVSITKPLTLEGEGAGVTTIKPGVVFPNTTSLFSGALIAAILLVDETTGVAVSDFTYRRQC